MPSKVDKRVELIISARDQTSRAILSFRRKISSLQAQVVAAAAVVGVGLGAREFIRATFDAADAAGVQEQAVIRLAQAVRNNTTEAVGPYVAELERQATAFQRLTGVGDEIILQQQGILTAYGATRDNIEALTQASLDLAAGTGQDIEQAFRNVGRTLGGYAGELGEILPQLKELTAEQLRAGDGARVIAQIFGGQAARQLDTYKGEVAALRGAYGDLQEAVGGPVSTVIKEFSQNALRPAIEGLTDGANASEAFEDAILDAGIALGRLGLIALDIADGPVGGFLFDKVITEAGRARAAFDAVSAGLERLGFSADSDFSPAFQTAAGLLRDYVDELEKAKNASDEGLGDGLSRAAESTLELGNGMRAVVEFTTVAAQNVVTLDQALGAFVQGGVIELQAELIRTNSVVEGLGDSLARDIRGVGVSAAVNLGTALSDAAFEGDLNFREFFANFARQITAAIAQALILRAILAATGGTAAPAIGAAGGSGLGSFIPGLGGLNLFSATPGTPGGVTSVVTGGPDASALAGFAAQQGSPNVSVRVSGPGLRQLVREIDVVVQDGAMLRASGVTGRRDRA